MKYFILLTVLIEFSYSITGQNFEDNNCYTVIVGKNASFDGSVLIGHNEDDYGTMLINWFRMPERNFSKSDSIKLNPENGKKQNKKTVSYLRFQVTGEIFGDAYLNDKSVFICSNASKSKEDTAEGIIGIHFRKTIAEQANTAKDAVILGGKLIETYGYEASGRTYTFADKNEAWMMSIIKGKHWVAQKIPDSCIAIIPNYYTIQDIDLTDSLNFLGSTDIVEYALSRGWYHSNHTFNFREVYGDSATNCADFNIPRHLKGLNFFSDTIYSGIDNLPFAFVPKKKVELDDIKQVLSSHYVKDSEYNCTETNPHICKTIPVCRQITQYSIIAQLRSNLPNMIGALVWVSPYNPCIFPFIPIYSGIFDTPELIRLDNSIKSDNLHFKTDSIQLDKYPEHSYSIFYKYKKYIENNYFENIKESNIFKQKIEAELKMNQLKLEKSVNEVYNSYPDDARKILTHYCNGYIQMITDYYKTQLKLKDL